jgi:hypothetical protein
MKQHDKARGHTKPRKQSLRLPAEIKKARRIKRRRQASEHQHVIPSEAEGPAYSASADRRIPYSVF